MEHQVLYRRDGYYSGFPHIDQLRDGRLAVRLTSSLHGDHYLVGLTGKKIVLVSDDEGRSWAESDDPSVPYNWAGGFGYEHSDSFAAVMAEGTYVFRRSDSLGNLAGRTEPGGRQPGLRVRSTPRGRRVYLWSGSTRHSPGAPPTRGRPGQADTGEYRASAWPRTSRGARSSKTARYWSPSTATTLLGTRRASSGRSGDSGVSWRLISTGPHASGVRTDETAYVEVSPGRVLGLSRNETGYFSEAWSDDGGLTWSHPLLTDIWAPSSPAHLLKLRDGRILCTYGLRRAPMGIRAVLSEDEGQTWDTDNTVILREDGGTSSGLKFPPREEVDLEELRLGGEDFRRAVDREVIGRSYPSQNARSDVGYPVSVQLSDDAHPVRLLHHPV